MNHRYATSHPASFLLFDINLHYLTIVEISAFDVVNGILLPIKVKHLCRKVGIRKQYALFLFTQVLYMPMCLHINLSYCILRLYHIRSSIIFHSVILAVHFPAVPRRVYIVSSISPQFYRVYSISISQCPFTNAAIFGYGLMNSSNASCAYFASQFWLPSGGVSPASKYDI